MTDPPERNGSPQTVAERAATRLQAWLDDGLARRLLDKDPTLWAPLGTPEVENRLGWLDLAPRMAETVPYLTAFADEVRAAGMTDVVVLGMGGSSLAPEVFQSAFGNAPGRPRVTVLDSTHPHAVTGLATALDVSRTLFVVSSKSGTTTETLSFFHYFWTQIAALGQDPGPHFVAITDPGTPLETLAAERGFRRTFLAPEDVGGRYSALSVFGLAPAALIGVDVTRLLARVPALDPSAPETARDGVALGALLGEAALAGRDKLTFVTTPGTTAMPAWIEQLIAESTGKAGIGIVPIVDEPTDFHAVPGADRVYVNLALASEMTETHRQTIRLLRSEHPVVDQILSDVYDWGRLIVTWEVGTAVAGAILGINPFDQPDVQLAKDLARAAMADGGGADAGSAPDAVSVTDPALRAMIETWLSGTGAGDFIGVQAYLRPDAQTWGTLQAVRGALGVGWSVATTLGYGPRFLHSTGQLHKGGPATGRFLQIVDDASTQDVPVPGMNYTFGSLITAQAAGDAAALRQRGHAVLRVNLGSGGNESGLAALLEQIQAAAT